MGKVYPFITNDGSVGLYSADFDDIYHSVTGAYSEAWEKFTLNASLSDYINNKTIKVLDLCYGIGYNTKSLLQNFFEIQKINNIGKLYTETIYSDNILQENRQVRDIKISVDAVDLDKNLMCMAPLFKIFKRAELKKQKIPNNRIKKYFADKIYQKYKYEKFIDYLILMLLVKSDNFKTELSNIAQGKSNQEICRYFSPAKMAFIRFLLSERHSDTHMRRLSSFVHNIYYHHISSCYKKALKAFNDGKVDIRFINDDARNFVKSSDRTYDLIFLDGFTTNKCPCLWTYDFFKELYDHLSPNGKLITYSNAAHVRNSMLAVGFNVGKIYNANEGKYTGTIAVKNKSFIKHELTESDLRLVKSRAGVMYRDENLNAPNEVILNRREAEVKNSHLLSSSQAAKINNETAVADV